MEIRLRLSRDCVGGQLKEKEKRKKKKKTPALLLSKLFHDFLSCFLVISPEAAEHHILFPKVYKV
jgi:hypothetical protein